MAGATPMAFLILASCGGGAPTERTPKPTDPPPLVDSGVLPPTDTGTSAPGTAAATCAAQPHNVLRYDCDVVLTQPGAVEIRFGEVEDPERRVLSSTSNSTTHRITLYGLAPETTHAWSAYAASGGPPIEGTFTTGKLPEALDITFNVVSSGTHTLQAVALPFSCRTGGYLIIADDRGRILWYEDLAAITGAPFVNALSVTPENTLLATLGRSQIVEVDLEGNVLLHLERDVAFEQPVHHDLTRHEGHTYALFAHEVTGTDGMKYITDGVYVFDPDGNLVAEWALDEVFPPSGGPTEPFSGYWFGTFAMGAHDWSHANSIQVDEHGDWLVSFRHLDTVVKVMGDWTSPDFGTPLWVLAGSDRAPLGSDFVRLSSTGVDPADFVLQHHPHVSATGRFLVFDNRSGGASRVLELDVDAGAGTADFIQSWSLERWCPVMGSAFELPSGNIVADCASSADILELDPSGQTVLELGLGCSGMAFGGSPPRAVPISL